MDKPLATPDKRSLEDLLVALYGRLNYERQLRVSPKGFKLRNMRDLLARMGNPHFQYPVVHVAGTKGKGSVATMVGQILSHGGYKTGVYTSPHLETIHQRMAIDGQLITDDQLADLLVSLEPAVEAMDAEMLAIDRDAVAKDRVVSDSSDDAAENFELPVDSPNAPTFFEITTAAALQHFANQKVDAAVLEVGLGGRMDSTNVCQPSVCIITNISFDHTRQLGSTISKIAFEKAGIIKPGVPVISGAQHPDAISTIEKVAADVGAPLLQRGKDFDFEDTATDSRTPLNECIDQKTFSVAWNPRSGDSAADRFAVDGLKLFLPGVHQRGNASLAVAAAVQLRQQGWALPDKVIRSGLRTTRLGGRAEILSTSPLVMMDIAHNPASAQALAATLTDDISAWRRCRKRTLIFSTSRDKDAEGILRPLVKHFDSIVVTRYQTNPRACDLNALQAASQTVVQQNVAQSDKGRSPEPVSIDVVATPIEAWERSVQQLSSEDAICVAGSAFLVAELRPIVQKWAKDRTGA